jgi:hypothetical protein
MQNKKNVFVDHETPDELKA